ncbi:MAG: hypothetical protein AVDCRST_MAG93-1033 [uncultured Chloroflexia bacterium]|uniref:Response regulatory domain-containing protein n=1 Tax=uncultured Chloroflexia bacterium TaxID=1672391 RepID=A0A6J4HY75_9CHLR|nr:MAG: hypothetical protein AVDCRST_MAG93-1033 [uncultured Chloroflexia bacterium]
MRQTEELESKSISIWVSGSGQARIALELEQLLGVRTRVYKDGEVSPHGALPHIILCPSEEDVTPEVKRLLASAPDVPLLVLGSRLDEQLARRAFLAGAHGFIHLEMQPAQIGRILSSTSSDETMVPRDLLEVFLYKTVAHADQIIFTPHQREFLELVATTASFTDEIVVPRQLLEAFLKRDP